MKKGLPTTLLAFASIAAGFGFYLYSQQQQQAPATTAAKPAQAKPAKRLSVLNTKRAAFELPDLEGTKHHIKKWDGKVILLNFWATWCPPCRKEIPAFVELQDDYGEKGFQVIGVAIDEKQAVEDFADGHAVNYPMLIGDNRALQISSEYGNRFGQLPYSLVIDRQGIIRFIGKRELSYEDIEKVIKPLL